MVGAILTLGFFTPGSIGKIVSIGYSVAAVATPTPSIFITLPARSLTFTMPTRTLTFTGVKR